MKPLMTVLSVLTAVAVAFPALGQEGQMPMPQPTEHHKVLAEDVGEWVAEVTLWPEGPDSTPMTSTATETNRMVGGFWLLSEFKGNFMGQPFEGHATIGYDIKNKKYVGSWVDSSSPHISHMEGTYDAKTKTMTMMMSGLGPDESEQEGKNVSVAKDKDTRVFTMYMKAGEEYIKSMEITYRRKKQ